jgi:cell wall-associated NlpC family hydrolase
LSADQATNNIPEALQRAVYSVTNKFAPDGHAAICRITPLRQGGHFVLKGDVQDAAARTEMMAAVRQKGLDVRVAIDVLPDPRLGDRRCGIATLSVVNVREKPNNAAEMGTQMLTGECFRVWKEQSNWFLVQTADGYVGWAERGGFVQCTRSDVDAWQSAPHLIITAYEERILEKPEADALPVSDVVMGCQVKRLGESGDWFEVALADGRSGYLPKASAKDYAAWKDARRPTPENIERTARNFLGRPYSWGGNSIRGLDCSGLTKLVFFLNGIDLRRNANEQCTQGQEVPVTHGYAELKKGDLLFFGRQARGGQPEWVNHTGIYLGDGLFIQASERVRISSLDKASPLADQRRIRSLLHARRLLPAS